MKKQLRHAVLRDPGNAQARIIAGQTDGNRIGGRMFKGHDQFMSDHIFGALIAIKVAISYAGLSPNEVIGLYDGHPGEPFFSTREVVAEATKLRLKSSL